MKTHLRLDCRVLRGVHLLGFLVLTYSNSLFGQWIPLFGPSTYINAFAVADTNLFVGTNAGVFRTTDNGTSWITANTGLTNVQVLALAVSRTQVFAGTFGGGIFASSDNGANWAQVNSGLTSMYIRSLVAIDTVLFAGTDTAGVFRSTDNGISWTSANDQLTERHIRVLAVNGSFLFAGTYGGGIFVSANNSTNPWFPVNSGLTNLYVFAINGSDSLLFAAVGFGGLLRSNNKGSTWLSLTPGLTSNFSALAVADSLVFAGNSSGGILVSTDNGNNWTAANSGLTNLSVSALLATDGLIFAGTGGGGVFGRPLFEMITDVGTLAINPPARFTLEQNFPNPFNPATILSFGVPSRSFVSLRVFDVLGREVAVLVSEELPAGAYSRQWNATDLAGGIYLYRLQAGQFVQTKKLILLR